tara:strand:- start:1346 stop:1837 length:492 start_codon:yes stop_codon:yes gene_type:complete
MKRLLVFVLILAASNITFSQSKKMSSKNNLNGNNISLNLGSALIINGIGLKYERLIPRKKVYYTLMGGVHFNRINFFGVEDHLTIYFSNGLITGINKQKHFEASFGLGLDQSIGYLHSTGFRYIEFAPIFNIGYRFQVPDESYVFRSGIGFPELIYLGFGMSF